MNLGVLTVPTSWYWHDLQRAALSSDTLVALSFTTLAAQLDPTPTVRTAECHRLDHYDALLVRSMPPGSLEQVVFRMNALHRVQAQGLPVLNPPRALEIAVDKYLASAELQAAGLPIPRTRTSQTWEDAMRDFAELGADVVIKPLFGAEGRGITRITDEAIAWRVFKTYQQLGHVIYLQEFVPHGDYDLRVLIIGEKAYCIRRRNPADWRTNVSRGAWAESHPLDDTLAELSWRAARAAGAPFVGVDILPGEDGRYYVLEVNAVPGWKGLARALQVDIAAEVLRWLRTYQGNQDSRSSGQRIS